MIIGVDGTVFIGRLTGIGKYIFGILGELAEERPNDDFFIYTSTPLGVIFSQENVTIKIISQSKATQDLRWYTFLLGKRLKNDNVSVFVASYGVAPFYIPCKVILAVHDFVYRKFIRSMSIKGFVVRKILQPYWIKRADIIFTNSKATAEDLRLYYRKNGDAVLYPSVDSSYHKRTETEIRDCMKKYRINSDYYLLVGTLEPRKNLELFLQCYSELRQSVKGLQLPVLVIVGKQGWKSHGLQQQIKYCSELGYLQYPGYVDEEDMPALYSGAKIYFMPSLYEGFGIPLLEARSCCCPVVSSDVPAMHEAAGNSAYYHAPDKTGILQMLERIFSGEISPVSDCAEDVNWSNRSNARVLSGLIDGI